MIVFQRRFSWLSFSKISSDRKTLHCWQAAGAGLKGPSELRYQGWALGDHDLDRSNGDVLSMTDSVGGTWSYAYDDFNRLTSGSATAGVDNGLALGWNYDRFSNRWARSGCDITSTAPSLTIGCLDFGDPADALRLIIILLNPQIVSTICLAGGSP